VSQTQVSQRRAAQPSKDEPPVDQIPAARNAETGSLTSEILLWGRSVRDTVSPAAHSAPKRRPVLLSKSALAIQAAVLVALITGTMAFISLDKTVTLSVDGDTEQLQTFGRTVGDVLDREGIEVDSHDAVSPDLGSSVADGGHITVRNGRLLTLTVDGETREVWVTAASVDEALQQLGIRAEGAFLSASRSSRVPLEGLALTVGTPKDVTVVADGSSRTVRTSSVTVEQLLAEQRITLGAEDRVEPARTGRLATGATVTVVRVRSEGVVEEEAVPFNELRTEDPNAFKGDETVLQQGIEGQMDRSFSQVVVDGRVTERVLLEEVVTRQPVDKIVSVGTKERPAPPPGPSPTGDGLNWAALAECESGGNPRAVSSNGRYFGLYQFSLATWHSVGGTGSPADASPEEQTARAQALLARSGVGQWPTCGPRLFT
jgi:resuscitation-promoting factor RpfB